MGTHILEVVLEQNHFIPADELPDWVNAIGLIMANLPEAYWEGLYVALVNALGSAPLTQWTLPHSPFKVRFECLTTVI